MTSKIVSIFYSGGRSFMCKHNFDPLTNTIKFLNPLIELVTLILNRLQRPPFLQVLSNTQRIHLPPASSILPIIALR